MSPGSRPAASALNSAASAAAGLNLPAVSRFSEKGRLIAPGICPATGSSGSTSPRYRSRARASTSSNERVARLPATACASTGGVTRCGANVVAPTAGVSVVKGRPSRVHSANPPSSTATASCPSTRSIHQRRAAYAPLPWSWTTTCFVASMPSRPNTSAQAAEPGSGCRPLRPDFGADRSRSICANRAPGMWPRRNCDRPQCSGSVRSCLTSTMTTDGSSSRAARSDVPMSVVNIRAA